MTSMFEPGMMVYHPARPEWGLGQVQSNIGGRVTVNFEHAGKVGDALELDVATKRFRILRSH